MSIAAAKTRPRSVKSPRVFQGTTASEASSSVKSPPSKDEVVAQCRQEIAADNLARGVRGTFSDLHLALMYVVDADMLAPDGVLTRMAKTLCDQGHKIEQQLTQAYPKTVGSGLLKVDGANLHEEIDYYRQERFWTNRNLPSLLESEELIRALFAFFREVVQLLRYLDSVNYAFIPTRDFPDLTVPANRYEAVIAD